MKKKIICSCVLVLVMTGLIFLPHTAYPGQIGVVDAYFQSTEKGVNTQVVVYAHGGKYDALPRAFIRISQSDSEDTPILELSGSVELTDNALEVSGTLDSGRLTTTVAVTDLISEEIFNVDIDLAWSGAGDLVTSQSDFYFQAPGVVKKMKGRSPSKRRLAQCAGNVLVGERDFTPNLTQDAEVLSFQVSKERK
jgi:hypothetical protein